MTRYQKKKMKRFIMWQMCIYLFIVGMMFWWLDNRWLATVLTGIAIILYTAVVGRIIRKSKNISNARNKTNRTNRVSRGNRIIGAKTGNHPYANSKGKPVRKPNIYLEYEPTDKNDTDSFGQNEMEKVEEAREESEWQVHRQRVKDLIEKSQKEQIREKHEQLEEEVKKNAHWSELSPLKDEKHDPGNIKKEEQVFTREDFSMEGSGKKEIREKHEQLEEKVKKNAHWSELSPSKDEKRDSNNMKKEEQVPVKERFAMREEVSPDGAKRKEIASESSKINLEKKETYIRPSLAMLNPMKKKAVTECREALSQQAELLEETLESFGVKAKVLNVTQGPAITRYELQPERGVKVSKVTNLSDDIALNMAAPSIRIEAPIPGKAAIGIEVPNKETSLVTFREIIEKSGDKRSKALLPFAIGKNISGDSVIFDLTKAPHLLIAGATGSGKSVCINTLILSLLFSAEPEHVKLLLIDPKVVELNRYNGIPHLITPVISDPKKATTSLKWAVQEMEDRYQEFASMGVRDIEGYHQKESKESMPYVMIIIDELADLMMVAAKDVEDTICRLAQKARAAGIHLVLATQRPSVDVITGLIKANIPSRIAFSVASQIDSRTILDMAGAEKLLGRGDMLFHPVGVNKPMRIQGAFLEDEEVQKTVQYLKQFDITNMLGDRLEEEIDKKEELVEEEIGESEDVFQDALRIAFEHQQISISMLQRKLKMGFNRAARLIDEMEERGYVGPSEGTKPRKVITGSHSTKIE
ncbi:DNA translocase FtsK [Tindallia californiensis]|uniref:Ftsk gamma domain-containing protein n=1 Tax=Tindallia californiensis TaxID=159292 RepID=A0A1H3IKY5_9FIRM|nr:DNA translocase FtsK [Tindallia californiensis]SDY28342.1 Ftsk gamma domain-containing protein [Tindallia californiensis]